MSAFVLNWSFKKSNELVHKCPRSALRNQIQKKFQRMTNVFHSVECLNLVLSHSKHWRTFIHTKFEKQILSVLNPVALLKSCIYWRSCFLIPGYQTLTRVSISRNSRREMIQIFLSRSREANFHVSFSSRFSRIGGKVSLSPLDFQDLKIISLSFLDPFLFLLSTFKILEKISLFSSRFS